MRWLLGTVVVLLLALILRLGFLAYAMYALLTALLVGRWLADRWIQAVVARRQCDRLTAEVGDVVTVLVTLENTGPLPIAWLLAEDLLPRQALLHDPPNLEATGRRILLASFRPRATRTMLYQLKCNRRGFYRLGPTLLETGDLLGLHRRYRLGEEPQFLTVYPELMPLEGYDVASRRPVGETVMTHRLFEDPTRISGVREYQAGDPLSRVHWRASARTGTLHSKTYEASCVAGATLVLDFQRAAHATGHEPFRSELAIVAAASIANALYQSGRQVGLTTNGRDAAERLRRPTLRDADVAEFARTRGAANRAAEVAWSDEQSDERRRPLTIPTGRGPDQFLRIRELLARLELADGLSLPELLRESACRLPRDATVLVVLPQATTETAIALGDLRRRGYSVTALVNLYDEHEFAAIAGMLAAEGVSPRQLRDRASVTEICRGATLGDRSF